MIAREGWDVICVGGGIAGLVAAVRAAELGLRAVVLERGAEDDYPCNSRYSGGIIHASYHDVKRDPEDLLNIIRTATSDGALLPLASAIAKDAGALVSWLQDIGVRFMRFSQLEFHRWCMAPPRTVNPGLDWKGRGPDITLRLLTARLGELGGAVALGTKVKALRMSGGRCIGVITENGAAGDVEWTSSSVVIADGGFQANGALFRKFVAPAFDKVFQRGAATGRGDGLEMAQHAGAAIIASPFFYGHVLALDSFENDRVWPYPELDAIACGGLVVGGDGQRVLDEGLGGIAVTNALARLEDPTSCTAIFDAAIWEGPGKTARIPANPLLERAGGTVFRAESIEALALMLDLPAGALVETIRTHNAAIASGSLEDMTPRRSSREKAWPIMKPPFMAIRICPGITYTMGGIATDQFAQVLDTAGNVIPGLYAAGATTGGLEGANATGYVGGLVKSGVMGKRAGERIAHLREQAAEPI